MTRNELYDLLVNRHVGIRERYHNYHDGSGGTKKVLSYFYLMLMNFQYYALHRKNLDMIQSAEPYEEAKLDYCSSESETVSKSLGTPEDFVKPLMGYDYVSFDLFDTLIFRPFSKPVDLFYLLDDRLCFSNFKQIRQDQEKIAREIHRKSHGDNEVSLKEIWAQIEENVGAAAAGGLEEELQLERDLCFANPYMKEVWRLLSEKKKKIIVVSDMYLPASFLRELLDKNGFTGYEELFVSCEYGAGKSDGGLYRLVNEKLNSKRGHNSPKEKLKVIHIGDNIHSDYNMAKENGWDAVLYPNPNTSGAGSRPKDMSAIVGSVYRGLVNSRLRSGLISKSLDYEYGFVFGGLFVTGYCQFIHEYVQKNNVDKVLFLARDGDILKQVYDSMYPDENTGYLYWSRFIAAKLMMEYKKQDYYRRFIDHRVGKGHSVRYILETMGLEGLIPALRDSGASVCEDDTLTSETAGRLKEFLSEHYDEIYDAYKDDRTGAERYVAEELAGCKNVAAVDIGWEGSGALNLAYLVERVWKLPCKITGLVAGTNTIYNDQPDASESFLQNKKLTAYMYSQSMNRDLLKKHDPSKGYNMFWELLVSSPTRQFKGFKYTNGEFEFVFGPDSTDLEKERIRSIQEGIRDFAECWQEHTEHFPFKPVISGRDAYAPMLIGASDNEKYLREILRRFSIDMDIC